ncbi:MAG: flagellar filament capping protein FliD [Spirochaetaceae bacterium]
MSDIAIPGFSNDSNSAKQVENLMKAKRIPLEKMEIKQEEFTNLKGIWQDLNVTLSKLSDSANKLYGFENPFSEKTVNSSNDTILTAESERNAIDENMSFIVDKIATSDKFVSKQINNDTSIPRGNYTFSIGDNDTVFKYRGGKLEDFVTKINKKNPDEIRASLIKNSKETQVLLIESLVTGEDNSLIFKEDSIKLGIDLGIIKKNNIENNQIKVDDIISSKGAVKKTELDLKLPPATKASFRVNSEINDSDIIEITVELLYTPNVEDENKLIDDINVASISLDNITIDGAAGGGLERFNTPEESNLPPVLDMNIVSITDEDFIIDLDAIVNIDNKKQIVSFLGSDIKNLKSINIVNNNSEKTLLVHSVLQKKGAGDGDYIPVKPITVANNASISMNGMKIERESNTIDDLIDGTTLYLHSSDPDEEVNLKIDFNTELARDQILDFMYNYNESIQKILLLTNDDKAILSEIEFTTDSDKEKAEEIQGLLKGDRTLNSIKQNLLRSVTNVYPSDTENGYKLLKSIGISTNASGTSGVSASQLRGYIEANVEELEAALNNNIESVRKLFGNDTNSDFIIDTGVAKVVDDLIKPYTRSGGTIASRITTIDGQIKRSEKNITDYKDDLISYEQTIRQKYGKMDATMSSLNSSMQAIENLTNTGDN